MGSCRCNLTGQKGAKFAVTSLTPCAFRSRQVGQTPWQAGADASSAELGAARPDGCALFLTRSCLDPTRGFRAKNGSTNRVARTVR